MIVHCSYPLHQVQQPRLINKIVPFYWQAALRVGKLGNGTATEQEIAEDPSTLEAGRQGREKPAGETLPLLKSVRNSSHQDVSEKGHSGLA